MRLLCDYITALFVMEKRRWVEGKLGLSLASGGIPCGGAGSLIMFKGD